MTHAIFTVSYISFENKMLYILNVLIFDNEYMVSIL